MDPECDEDYQEGWRTSPTWKGAFGMFGLKKTGTIVLFKCVITERSHEIQGDGDEISQDLAVSL